MRRSSAAYASRIWLARPGIPRRRTCDPSARTGFRLGFALTLLGTIIGEMFASQRGIGYMLLKAMEANEPTTIMALAFLLIAFATSAS